VAYILATAAAFANSLTSTLQRSAAITAPEDSAFKAKLIWYLVRRKVWLAGMLAMIAAFVLQAAALHYGQLTTVQPILVAELIFTLAILYLWFHSPIGLMEWAGGLSIALGLATFLYSAHPHAGHSTPSTVEWLAASGATALAALGAVAFGRGGSKARKAVAYGTAAAIIWGFTAALIKTMTGLIPEGWRVLFTHWPVYAVVGVGVTGLVVVQSAFQAGPLTASQPALIIVDPIVSIFLGVWLFDDRLASGRAHIFFEVVGILIMVAGVLVLCRSPLITGKAEQDMPEMAEEVPAERDPPWAGSVGAPTLSEDC
jgi:drug/metabolite transporter (DMT)-like permease